MTDIDFDELDKAVNSLMGTVGSKDKEDRPKEKTFTVNSTLQPGEKPSYDRLGEVAKQIGSETLIGRGELTTVEDLPNPDETAPDANADHTPSETEQVVADTPEPELQTESPTESVVEQEAADAEMATESEPESISEPEQDLQSESEPKRPTIPAVKRPNSGRFMDVVHPSSDMRSSSDTPSLSVPERSRPDGGFSSTAPTVVATGMTEQDKDVAALQATPSAEPIPLTPFLPDAKVEKRPLGESPAIAANTSDGKQGTESVEPDKKSIESDEKADAQRLLDPSDFSAGTEAERQELQQIELADDEGLAVVESSSDTAAADTSAVAPSSGLSIQQIESGDTEHLSSGLPQAQTAAQPADTGGDVYGVKEYGPTVEHPAKQKSGWGTVVIIILVIIALAAVGIATYFILGMGS